jgi:bifunctional NMN adenylyltransferase/nudix hydrolase
MNTSNKKVALAIMRLQPLHDGHKILINEMFNRCDKVIIAIGSINSTDKQRNPFSFAQRKEMLLNAFKNKKNMHIIGIEDINAKTKQEWVNYVKEQLKINNLPQPTCYFSGSKEDASWYEESGWEIIIIDRYTIGKGICATQIRKELFNETSNKK